MKITLLGGGGFRTPLMVAALRRAASRLDLREIALYDVSEARLRVICRVLDSMPVDKHDPKLSISATADLDAALRDASFVLCAIRVGGLHARALEERLAIEHGVVGQETVGAAGLCLIMRSVGAISHIAERVAEVAPEAWFINFTNPVGAVCGMLRERLGDHVIGVCDTPADLFRRVARVLDRSADQLRLDYFGLNHLGWLRAIYDDDGYNVLPELLSNEQRVGQLEEARLFGISYLRQLGAIPIEYLTYYYFPERHLEAVTAAGYSRAEYLLRQQQDFYGAAVQSDQDPVLLWQAARADRERSYLSDASPPETWRVLDEGNEGYAAVALAAVEALATGISSHAVLDVPNRCTLPFLPSSATVEVPCSIDARGAKPNSVASVPEHASTLMKRVHAAEQGAVQATRSGLRADAVAALAAHPLVGSTERAERLFQAYLAHEPELAAQFA